MSGLYPVIMCGGGGKRLWPASRPGKPKPFLALTGALSLFQLAVRRAAPLAEPDGRVVVVGAMRDEALIIQQLADLGVEAAVILEPEGRDSAPAVASAAAWIAARNPNGVALVLASDHHIPNESGYRQALRTAADAAWVDGRIVTLGVTPRHPSGAYGYIRPAGPGLAAVAAFEEKPTVHRAAVLMAEGWLWNSGAFIARADVLIGELRTHAPDVLTPVIAALGEPADRITLGPEFGRSTRLSFDHAVMEKTDRAAVLPITLEWSDLGAWDAVAAATAQTPSGHLAVHSEGCFVRAPDGMTVATVGVSNIAVVIENGVVLICGLDHAQSVRDAAERAE